MPYLHNSTNLYIQCINTQINKSNLYEYYNDLQQLTEMKLLSLLKIINQ